MIFVNGAENPENVFFGLTSLDNVYFNNHLVWNRNKEDTFDPNTGKLIPNSGTIQISGGTSFAVDVPDVAMPDYSGGKQSAPSSLSTISVHYGPNRYMYFNDMVKQSDVGYYRESGGEFTQIGTGALYEGLLSIELEFNPNDWSPVYDYFIIWDSGVKYSGEYVTWSGIPSGMKLMDDSYGDPFGFVNELSLTCNVRLSGGGATQRVYTGTFETIMQGIVLFIRCDARGDESQVAAATSGYVIQSRVQLWLVNR